MKKPTHGAFGTRGAIGSRRYRSRAAIKADAEDAPVASQFEYRAYHQVRRGLMGDCDPLRGVLGSRRRISLACRIE